MFDYKAQISVKARDRRMDAVTKPADHSAPINKTKEEIVAARRSIFAPFKSKVSQNDLDEDLQDEDIGWNVFDRVETPTTLRPRPQNSRWDRGLVKVNRQSHKGVGDIAPQQNSQGETPACKYSRYNERVTDDKEEESTFDSKPGRSRSDIRHDGVKEEMDEDEKSIQKRKSKQLKHHISAPSRISKVTKPAQKDQPISHLVNSDAHGRESDSDSDVPLLRKRSRHKPQPMTPPESHAPSATPTGQKHVEIIDLENETGLSQIESPKLATRSPKVKTEPSYGGIKTEPLSAEIIACTFFRVSADNMPGKGPVRVPFSLYKTSEDLFTSMISERRIRQHNRISDITATFPWSKESIGIRKGRPEDWTYFCNSLGKAWEKESHRFEEECHIDIMIHVDEDQHSNGSVCVYPGSQQLRLGF